LDIRLRKTYLNPSVYAECVTTFVVDAVVRKQVNFLPSEISR
jgi:hypothetical protein